MPRANNIKYEDTAERILANVAWLIALGIGLTVVLWVVALQVRYNEDLEFLRQQFHRTQHHPAIEASFGRDGQANS
jgi:uncharacterized protein HemX